MENINILACAVIERAVTDYVEEISTGGHLIVDDKELERLAYSPWMTVLDVDPDDFIKACKERRAEFRQQKKVRFMQYEDILARI